VSGHILQCARGARAYYDEVRRTASTKYTLIAFDLIAAVVLGIMREVLVEITE